MPYMLLIVEPVGQRHERGLEQGKQVYARMQDFGATLQAQGLLGAAASLESERKATRLRKPGGDGKAVLLDGPYAEAKEMVGGFFLLNVDSREEALAIAAQCPAAEWATIEIRAVAPCYDD